MLVRQAFAATLILSFMLTGGCAHKSGGLGLFGGNSGKTKTSMNPFKAGGVDYAQLGEDLRDGSGTAPESGALASAQSAAHTAQDSIGNALKKAGSSVTEALSVKPKVIPADDPISLSSKPQEISSDVYYQAGRLAEHNGKMSLAAKEYGRAIEVNPDDVRALISLARLHDRQEQFDQAVKLYQRAASVAPENAMVHNDLGLCFARQHKDTESIKQLQRAVEIEPQRKLYRNNLATVLVDLGRMDQAWQHLAAVHSTAIANYNMGYLLNRTGRKQEARERFAMAWQADPSLNQAKSMLDELDGAKARTENVARRTPATRHRVIARPVSSSQPAVTAAGPVQPVSSPPSLRRTPPPSAGSEASLPKGEPPVKLELPVPLTKQIPQEPVVKPATEPLPQPTNLKFPIRTVAAYGTPSQNSVCDLELPTPDELAEPTSILDDGELLSDE